jgi:hypothetical protein
MPIYERKWVLKVLVTSDYKVSALRSSHEPDEDII